MKIILVLNVVMILELGMAYEIGAPTEACDTMMPSHEGAVPQDTPSPYLVSISPATFGPDASVIVRISSFNEGDYYEGFMVQVRNADNAAMGKFEPNDDYLVINCPDGAVDTQNTATHNRHEHFKTTQMNWIAPSTPTNVTFTFTIVRGLTKFWTGIKLEATMTDA